MSKKFLQTVSLGVILLVGSQAQSADQDFTVDFQNITTLSTKNPNPVSIAKIAMEGSTKSIFRLWGDKLPSNINSGNPEEIAKISPPAEGTIVRTTIWWKDPKNEKVYGNAFCRYVIEGAVKDKCGVIFILTGSPDNNSVGCSYTPKSCNNPAPSAPAALVPPLPQKRR